MSSAPGERWAEPTAVIAAREPMMADAIARIGPCTLRRRRHPGGRFGALARSILHQQIAGAAAGAIHARFVDLYDGRPTPEAVLATPDQRLRAVGVSAAKAASIKDLAARVLDGTVPLAGLERLSDEAIVDRLRAVRGIGRWTGEMFLIFQLNRPDVWPVTDMGVRRGYARVHGLATPPEPAALARLGDVYRPYRTLAAWYCWRRVSPELGAW